MPQYEVRVNAFLAGEEDEKEVYLILSPIEAETPEEAATLAIDQAKEEEPQYWYECDNDDGCLSFETDGLHTLTFTDFVHVSLSVPTHRIPANPTVITFTTEGGEVLDPDDK